MKHIRILALILCACFVSVAWGQQPAGKAVVNWNEFHNQDMQRWSPYEDVLNVHNVGSLQPKWRYNLGYATTSSSPTVANGVLYIGALDGTVYALNASTGAKLWSYKTGGRVDSSPAVANGVVYVGSYDYNLYALNASTGAKLWTYHTGWLVDDSPSVANGVVYFGGGDGYVYALNARSRGLLWRTPNPGGLAV